MGMRLEPREPGLRLGRPTGHRPPNQAKETLMSSTTEIRTFRVDMPDEAIADLRRRLATTCWPSKELVADASQGVQQAMLQELSLIHI